MLEAFSNPVMEKVVKGNGEVNPANSYYYRNFQDVKRLVDQSNSKDEFALLLENDEGGANDSGATMLQSKNWANNRYMLNCGSVVLMRR